MANPMEDNPFAKRIGLKYWQEKEFAIPKPEEYLIDNLVPAGSLLSLQNNGIYGKATLALQMALSVAIGIPFLEEFKILQPGKVLYLNARKMDDENHRKYKRLLKEWAKVNPYVERKIQANIENLTYVSMYEDCLDLAPILVDANGGITRAYSSLAKFCDYYKPKLIVLDPVEDFYHQSIKNITEFYLKISHLKTAVLFIVGDKEKFDFYHDVDVSMYLEEHQLKLRSAYIGQKEIPLKMAPGIWLTDRK